MLTSDPHFYFFATSRAFSLCAPENPPFSVTDTLHTDYVLSTNWDGGSVPHSLTLSVFTHHLILSFSLITFVFSFFSLRPFPLLPSFLSLNVCMCMRLTSIAHLSLILHEDTGMRGSNTSLLEMIPQTLPQHLMLLGQQMCLCMACLLSMTLLSVSVRPQSSVLLGGGEGIKKRSQTFFCEL